MRNQTRPGPSLSDTHHGRHGEALEQEAFAAVAVALKDHEVSIVAHLPAQRPVNHG